jgi:cation diffusion facilitator CzcD-associated flavoprotein CzcO
MADRDRVLDVAIIGGGLAGLVHLQYARQAGLDALVLERQSGVGGLWRQLPTWQDIQICPVDWTAGDLPIDGPAQPQILSNIASWVDRFDLSGGIRLNCPVHLARNTGTCWELDTPLGTLRARHLVAATGGHNSPVIPDVVRRNSTVREFHSSALAHPAQLAGQDVVVVGGGASAFDLLDQCLENQARRIHWVYRGLRWFTPTTKPKAIAGSFRPYAKMQASGMPVEQQNALIDADLRDRYAKFGIQDLQPAKPIDMRHDQLIPGRARMLANLPRIERHPGTVQTLEDNAVLLADGTRLSADTVLWGTGYATDLSYFEDQRIASIRSIAQMASRCGCVFRSLDLPDLYFTCIGLEGVGATSFMYSIGARTVMSHIRGTAQLDMEPVPNKLNHLDLIRHLASRDLGSFGPGTGWEHFRELAAKLPDDAPYPLP